MSIPQVRLLEIDKIRFDPAETQARVKINDESIQDYIQAYKDGAAFPPVICYYDGADYWLADGFHRVLAAREAGFKDIAVDVQPGGKLEAKWHAAGANVSHGIRRTNADKRKAVEFALAVHPEYSDHNIAKHAGVGHPLVSEVRKSVGSSSNSTNSIDPINNVEKRVGTDGKSYPVRHEIPPPPPDPMEFPPSDQPAPQAENRTMDTPPGAKMDPPKKQRVLDDIGNDVPERVQALWARRQEAVDILTMLSKIKSAMLNAMDTKDPLWTEVNMNCLQAELSTLHGTLSVLKPHVVCPYCGGMTPECRTCKGRGLVSKHYFNTFTARENREFAIAAGERNKASLRAE